MSGKTPKLAEIAKRIAAHLYRIEMAQPDHGSARSLFWNTGAISGGARVFVTYISYQGHASLTKADALKYLAWLDAGNVGKHWQALRQ